MNRFSYKNILVAGGNRFLGTSLQKDFLNLKYKLISSFVTQNLKDLGKYYKNMIF